MTNLFTLTLVIGIFLLGIGYGANVPVTTEPSDIVTAGTSKNCTPLTGFRIISCFFVSFCHFLMNETDILETFSASWRLHEKTLFP